MKVVVAGDRPSTKLRPMMLGMCIPTTGWEPLDPEGPTGKRLVDLIGRECFDKFDRTNVLDRRIWSREKARARADEVIKSMEGRTVMVFGNEAWLTLSLPKALWLDFVVPVYHGVRMAPMTKWYRVPHPSGRNRWFNEPKRRIKVRELFEKVADANRSD